MSYKTRVRRISKAVGLSYQVCFAGLKLVNAKVVALAKVTGWREFECDLFFAKWRFEKEAIERMVFLSNWSTANIVLCSRCSRPTIHTLDASGTPVLKQELCHWCHAEQWFPRSVRHDDVERFEPDYENDTDGQISDYLMETSSGIGDNWVVDAGPRGWASPVEDTELEPETYRPSPQQLAIIAKMRDPSIDDFVKPEPGDFEKYGSADTAVAIDRTDDEELEEDELEDL